LRRGAQVAILVPVRRHDPVTFVLPAEHADNLLHPSLTSGFGASSRAVVQPDWAAAPEVREVSALRTRHNASIVSHHFHERAPATRGSRLQ
jgi:hypothetical protein